MTKVTADELLRKAPETLHRLKENSPFFTSSIIKEVPAFQPSELSEGDKLGFGSYCNVYEINKFHLIESKENPEKVPNTENGRVNNSNGEINIENSMATQDSELVNSQDSALVDPQDEADKNQNLTPFDEKKTRKFMAKHCQRDGSARYAMKRLRLDLDKTSRTRGILDLAIEIEFLSALEHPNIIKMRGNGGADRIRLDNFIVLDRLYGTLDEKIQIWEIEWKKNSGCMGCFGVNTEIRQNLTLERCVVAYDIASALMFIHGKNLIYRDLKPDNIGFDVRGDAKLFDFGLCKELRSELRVQGDLYKLTGLTGSRRYMAPEVVLCKPYNLKADVYSFGLLLYQVMSFKCPFENFSSRDHMNKVVIGNYRPFIPKNILAITRNVIEESWSPEIGQRPDFQGISSLLRVEMNVQAEGNQSSEVLHRTEHMLNRSSHSIHMASWRKQDSLALSSHGDDKSK